MIPARKQALFNAWFAGVARSRLQRAFDRARVRGLDRARALVAEGPVLVVSNHTSWWDPLVALHASQHLLGADGHALMDARNLRRLPFFAMVGAFGVDLEQPADGAAAVRYAARLLDRPGRLVWIFPQGILRPITERPLAFRPATLRYELGPTEKPVLHLSFGEPIAADRDPARGRASQEEAVEVELARIERAVRGEVGLGFEEVWKSSGGVAGALATRALAALTARAARRA